MKALKLKCGWCGAIAGKAGASWRTIKHDKGCPLNPRNPTADKTTVHLERI